MLTDLRGQQADFLAQVWRGLTDQRRQLADFLNRCWRVFTDCWWQLTDLLAEATNSIVTIVWFTCLVS